MKLTEQERKTLADALDAYRSVRTGNHEWMRLPYMERMSPAALDDLSKKILSEEIK